MQKMVLGSDVPELLVILQAGFTNKFAISLQVEPGDLVGIIAKLKLGETSYTAVLDGTSYIWILTVDDVSTVNSLSSAVLSIENIEDKIKLASGKVEVRL